MIWRFPREKMWGAWAGENLFGRSDFSIFFFFFFFLNPCRSKIQNPARGSKSPSRGGGVDLNFKGGHRKSKQVGVYTPWHPHCSPMTVRHFFRQHNESISFKFKRLGRTFGSQSKYYYSMVVFIRTAMSWKRRKCLKRAYFLPWTNRRQEMQGRFFKNINLNWIMKHFSRKSIFFSWLRMYSSIMVVFNGDTYVLLVLNQTNMYLVCRWPYVWGKVGSIIGNIDKCNTLPSFLGKFEIISTRKKHANLYFFPQQRYK